MPAGHSSLPIPIQVAHQEPVIPTHPARLLGEAKEIFNEVWDAIGIRNGVDGLTNMEAAFLISRLSEPEVAQQHVDAIWHDMGYPSIQATNDKFRANDYCIWNDYFENDSEYNDPNLSGHILLRSAQRGKIDFQDGIKSMLKLAKDNAVTATQVMAL